MRYCWLERFLQGFQDGWEVKYNSTKFSFNEKSLLV